MHWLTANFKRRFWLAFLRVFLTLKIAYTNLDSARTPVSHDESMAPPVSPQDELGAIDCSANEENSNKFISTNSSNSEYDTTEDPILFAQKHLNDLIRDLSLYRPAALFRTAHFNVTNSHNLTNF